METDEWLVRRMEHFRGEREAVKKSYIALALPRQISMDGNGDRSSFDVSPARTTQQAEDQTCIVGPVREPDRGKYKEGTAWALVDPIRVRRIMGGQSIEFLLGHTVRWH